MRSSLSTLVRTCVSSFLEGNGLILSCPYPLKNLLNRFLQVLILHSYVPCRMPMIMLPLSRNLKELIHVLCIKKSKLNTSLTMWKAVTSCVKSVTKSSTAPTGSDPISGQLIVPQLLTNVLPVPNLLGTSMLLHFTRESILLQLESMCAPIVAMHTSQNLKSPTMRRGTLLVILLVITARRPLQRRRVLSITSKSARWFLDMRGNQKKSFILINVQNALSLCSP